MYAKQFDELLDDLRSDNFSEEEILDIIHATKLEWAVKFNHDEITISDPATPEQILIRIQKKRNKWTWKSGLAFTKETAEQVRKFANELKSPHKHDFILSRILFSDRELTGNWVFESRAQIVPCISEMRIGSGLDWYSEVANSRNPRKSDKLIGPPFPFLLEVSVPQISNPWLQNKIGFKLLNRYQNLLSLFVIGVSANLSTSSERSWVALKSSQDAGIDYHLLTQGISTTKGGRCANWTNYEKASAPTYEGIDYLDSLSPALSKELYLPKNLNRLFVAYHSLETHFQRQFDRAAYFFALGNELFRAPDAAILNFAIAIEAMLEPESGERCVECKKPTGPSISKKFNQFIETYAPVSPRLVPFQQQLYGLRSRIAHGSKSMIVDQGIFSLANDDSATLLMAWLSRKALVQWLLRQSNNST